MQINSYEYTVTKKSEGRYKAARIFMIIFYVIYVLAFLIGSISIGAVAVCALIPVTLWIIIFFTWRYVSIEYKYEIKSGKLIFTEILGGRKEKFCAEFKISEAKALLPANLSHEISKYPVKKRYDASSSPSASDRYVLLCDDQNKTPSAIYIQAQQKAIKAIRYYMSQEARTKSDIFLNLE